MKSSKPEDNEQPFDVERYWAEEHTSFEESSLRPCKTWERFWRATANSLRETFLFPVFERFCSAFPDHPHDYNTVFYLFDHGVSSSTRYDVLMRCTHFEHTSLDDLRALADFLEFAKGVITADGFAHLDMFNGETLHLQFSHPNDETIILLQQRATRTAI